MQRHQNRVRFRILFLTVLISVAGLTILARLVHTQVFQAEEFRRLARQQHEGIIKLSPARGAIYDAAGRELAVSVLVDSVYVDPSLLDDPPRVLVEALSLGRRC